ncbi:MAG TPA: hypothetical protein VM487_12915 [Phycisphaerae bacterium]|nr:hypothetical protein [Phycisphaerae bacterium]
MNPYLNVPQGSGGGWMPAPGAAFGGYATGSGVYSPAAAAYFGAMAQQSAQCQPNGCGCGHQAVTVAADPCSGQAARLAQLAGLARHPLGQWPYMPPLDPRAQQLAAAGVVGHSQVHADNLVVVYGVDSGAILLAAGVTATITVTPQKRHIPEKLSLSTAMAAAFLITGIFAGVEPVLATTGPISAAIFIQDSTFGNFKSVVMDVGMDFSVGVTNISGAPARFTCNVVGKPVPPGL